MVANWAITIILSSIVLALGAILLWSLQTIKRQAPRFKNDFAIVQIALIISLGFVLVFIYRFTQTDWF